MSEPHDNPSPTKTQSGSPDPLPSAAGGDTLTGPDRPPQFDSTETFPFRPSEHPGDLGRFWHCRISDRGLRTLSEFPQSVGGGPGGRERVTILVVESGRVTDEGLKLVARCTGSGTSA